MSPVPPPVSPPARGDVWLVDFGSPVAREQGYRRPAVVLSADRLNTRSGLVIVVACTAAHRGLPTHVQLEPGPSGLRETSYAKAEDIKSVSTERLLHRLGTAPPGELAQLTRIVALQAVHVGSLEAVDAGNSAGTASSVHLRTCLTETTTETAGMASRTRRGSVRPARADRGGLRQSRAGPPGR